MRAEAARSVMYYAPAQPASGFHRTTRFFAGAIQWPARGRNWPAATPPPRSPTCSTGTRRDAARRHPPTRRPPAHTRVPHADDHTVAPRAIPAAGFGRAGPPRRRREAGHVHPPPAAARHPTCHGHADHPGAPSIGARAHTTDTRPGSPHPSCGNYDPIGACAHCAHAESSGTLKTDCPRAQATTPGPAAHPTVVSAAHPCVPPSTQHDVQLITPGVHRYRCQCTVCAPDRSTPRCRLPEQPRAGLSDALA